MEMRLLSYPEYLIDEVHKQPPIFFYAADGLDLECASWKRPTYPSARCSRQVSC